MPKTLLVFFVLCLLSMGATAQSVTITGRVTDAETDEGISFATVFVRGLDSTISTDLDGYYKIKAPLSARYIGAKCAGYIQGISAIHRNYKLQTVNLELEKIDSNSKRGAILRKSQAAALDIVHRVIRDKATHDVKTLGSYGYEAYTKIEVRLLDLTERFKQRKIFKPFQFVFEHIDTVNEVRPFLPFFLTETVSDYYHKKNALTDREIIKASRISGVEDLSITQFLGSSLSKTDIYSDYIILLKRQFVSPVSALGLSCYLYYMEDSQVIDHVKCYKIRFTPRSLKLARIEGEMWVASGFWAIKKIRLRVQNSKMSLVRSISLYDEFTNVGNSIWMLKREDISFNGVRFKNAPELVLRKTSFYNKIIINEKKNIIDSIFRMDVPDIAVNDSANLRTERYWQRMRNSAGTGAHEDNVYAMIDTLANMKITHHYINLFQTVVLGYVDVGPLSIGNLYSFIGVNKVDGWHVKYGMRTSTHFSKVIRLGGYGQYGFKSQKGRYGGEALWLIKRDPRISLSASYKFDLIPNRDYNSFYASPDFWTTYGLRRYENGEFLPLKLMETREFRLKFYQEFKFGYSYAIGILNQRLTPQAGFNFLYHNSSDTAQANTNIVSGTVTEFSLTQRFAWRERYLTSNFFRYGFGSRLPVVTFQVAVGVRSLLGSQFDYVRLAATVNDTRFLGLLGRLKYNIQAGKIFGTLPFIFLQTPNASETYLSVWPRFNTITQYQFAADRYVQAMAEHHLDGLILDRIPGVKRLRLREEWGAHMWWGDMSEANRVANYPNLALNPENTGLVKVQVADTKPFVEMNAGVENILTFFRLDAVWRMTDLDPRGTRFSFRYGNCGVRLSFSIQL